MTLQFINQLNLSNLYGFKVSGKMNNLEAGLDLDFGRKLKTNYNLVAYNESYNLCCWVSC